MGSVVEKTGKAPEYPLPSVTRVEELPTQLGYGDARAFHVALEDPFTAELAPHEVQEVVEDERVFSELARCRRERGLWKRSPKQAYDSTGNQIEGVTNCGDPIASRAFTAHIGGSTLAAWLGMFPRADALRFPSDPNINSVINDSLGSTITVDERVRLWWKACHDGRGIRSRAAVMSFLLEEYVTTQEHPDPTWLSLACGTALPAFQTGRRLEGGFRPAMHLVDIDDQALETALGLHERLGGHGTVTTQRANVFDPEEITKHRADITDAMGIFEYIGDPLAKLQRGLGIETSPSLFLRSCYEATNKRLIFGQMLSSRPNPDFLTGVLGWPFVEMRSVEQVVQIVADAGIETRRLSVFLPSDGVYAVYQIHVDS